LAHYISRQTQITIQYWRIFQQIKSSAGVKLEKKGMLSGMFYPILGMFSAHLVNLLVMLRYTTGTSAYF